MTQHNILLAALGVVIASAPADAQEMATGPVPAVLAAEEGERRLFDEPGRYMLLKVGPSTTGASYFFMGYEVLPPGAGVVEHRHERDEEILFIHRGRLVVTLDGRDHTVDEGGTIFLPPGVWISIQNPGPDPATFIFVFPRGSVESCFMHFGRDAEGNRLPLPEGGWAALAAQCQMTAR